MPQLRFSTVLLFVGFLIFFSMSRAEAQQTGSGVDEHCSSLVKSLKIQAKETPSNELQYNESNTVAFHFYWQELQTQELEGLKVQGKSLSKGETFALSPQASSQFLGFLEGRVGVTVPPRFKNRLQSLKIAHNKIATGPIVQMSPSLASVSDTPQESVKILEPFRLTESHIVNEDDNIKISTPKKFVDEIAQTASDTDCCIQIQSEKDKFFLLCVADRERPFNLYQIDASTKNVDWISSVFSGTPLVRGGSGSRSQWTHQPEIVMNDNHVVIFGFFSFSIYVEGFDRITGKSLFRYSSTY